MRIFTKERRRANRTRIRIDAVIVIETPKQVIDCSILDISLYGARLEVAADLVPDSFYLIDVVGPLVYLAQVAWRRSGFIGVRFRDIMLLSDDTAPAFLKQISIVRPDRMIEPFPRGVYRAADWVRNEDL